jgi:hypothetical protein
MHFPSEGLCRFLGFLHTCVLIPDVVAGGEIVSRTAIEQYFQFLRPSIRLITVRTSYWIYGLYYGAGARVGRVCHGPATQARMLTS